MGSFYMLFLRVEKTSEHVTLKNKGRTLYSQTFGPNDGNCGKPTDRVITQVWDYDGQLALAFSSVKTGILIKLTVSLVVKNKSRKDKD